MTQKFKEFRKLKLENSKANNLSKALRLINLKNIKLARESNNSGI